MDQIDSWRTVYWGGFLLASKAEKVEEIGLEGQVTGGATVEWTMPLSAAIASLARWAWWGSFYGERERERESWRMLSNIYFLIFIRQEGGEGPKVMKVSVEE